MKPSRSTSKQALLALISLSVTLAGCDNARKTLLDKMTRDEVGRNAKVDQALQNALRTSTSAEAQAWRQFLDHWPGARQRYGFAWHGGLGVFKGDASAAALLEDRYVFKAILDFQVTSNFQTVTFPKIRFHFAEVKRVILPPDGGAQGGALIYFQPDQKELGLADWTRLVGSTWDFSAVGISIVSNAPIKGIQGALPAL